MVVHHDHHHMTPLNFPPLGICRVQSLWYLYNPGSSRLAGSAAPFCTASGLPTGFAPPGLSAFPHGTESCWDRVWCFVLGAKFSTTGSQGLFWQIPLHIPCLLPLLPVLGHGHCCYLFSACPQLSVNEFMKNVIICLSSFPSVHNPFETLIKTFLETAKGRGGKKKLLHCPWSWKETLQVTGFSYWHFSYAPSLIWRECCLIPVQWQINSNSSLTQLLSSLTFSGFTLRAHLAVLSYLTELSSPDLCLSLEQHIRGRSWAGVAGQEKEKCPESNKPFTFISSPCSWSASKTLNPLSQVQNICLPKLSKLFFLNDLTWQITPVFATLVRSRSLNSQSGLNFTSSFCICHSVVSCSVLWWFIFTASRTKPFFQWINFSSSNKWSVSFPLLSSLFSFSLGRPWLWLICSNKNSWERLIPQ